MLSITSIDTPITGITPIISSRSHSDTVNHLTSERITAIKMMVELMRTWSKRIKKRSPRACKEWICMTRKAMKELRADIRKKQLFSASRTSTSNH
jgi:hypothetical protein